MIFARSFWYAPMHLRKESVNVISNIVFVESLLMLSQLDVQIVLNILRHLNILLYLENITRNQQQVP